MTPARTAFLVLLAYSAAVAFAAPPSQLSVNVKETQVRATPSYLGKVLGLLAYGDKVDVLETQKDWDKVSLASKNLVGWVNHSALTDKKVVIAAGSQAAGQNASSGEVALAGKGFSDQIETQYKQDGKIDYTWVDRMGAMNPPSDDIAAFLSAGGLAQGGSQ
jgi:uncharacterized protein YgiM (DUF1202 family)